MRQKGAGYTLVELLTAVAILSVSLLAILSAFPVAYEGIVYGGRVSQAVALAQQKLEGLEAGTFPPAGGSQSSPPYTVTWTVTSVGYGSAAGDLRRVVVTVTWPQRVRDGRYDLVGFVSRPY
jgi:prepilin-type N-terminal cleavage/methylation domain-containing protein